MKRMLLIGAALALGACAQPAPEKTAAPEAPIASVTTQAPAGAYALDKTHASLLVRGKHLGLSNYTIRFADWDATLQFDPADPGKSQITATVNPRSVRTDYPADYRARHAGSRFKSWDEDLALSDNYLNAAAFPEARFTSTAVTLTGPNIADVAGDLTIRGQTHPITLKARLNQGYAAHPFMPNGPALVGFSAVGAFKRSDYGVTFLLPAEAGAPGVSDEIELVIEAEFTRTDTPPAPAAP